MKTRDMEATWKKLVSIHLETLRDGSDSPVDCIKKCVEEHGLDAVKVTLAAAICLKEHDGRVKEVNKSFARNTLGDEERSDYSRILIHGSPNIDAIHPAHLDNLADALRRVCQMDKEENSVRSLMWQSPWCSEKVFFMKGNEPGLSLSLVCIEDGYIEPYMNVTLYVQDESEKCGPNEAYIKNWSENTGLDRWLIINNLAVPTEDFLQIGRVNAPKFRFDLDRIRMFMLDNQNPEFI